jgi:predicted Fe-S protein YdhL (DUF1289 family)
MTRDPSSTDDAEIRTPCINVCRLNASGLCVGCRRNVDEIMCWREMSDAERLRLMRDVLPARAVS